MFETSLEFILNPDWLGKSSTTEVRVGIQLDNKISRWPKLDPFKDVIFFSYYSKKNNEK